MNKKYWGYHIQCDVKGCDKSLVTNELYLKKWVTDLVSEIDMIAYGDPQVIHFGEKEIDLAGYTVIQLIETSNIMAHFCDVTGDAYIDVFSCKEYDYQTVIDHINMWFAPENIIHTILNRSAR